MTGSKHEPAVATSLDQVEQWLDDLEAATTAAHDGSPHRQILAARQALDDAEEGLGKAVTDARAAGYSWAMIGASLGVSRQAAQQRSGEVREPAGASEGERRPA